MTKRSASPFPFGATPLPLNDQKPARPDAVWIWLRLVVLLCVVVVCNTGNFVSWSSGSLIVQEGLGEGQANLFASVGQQISAFILRPTIFRVVAVVAGGGVLLVLGELVFGLMVLVTQRSRLDTAGYTYVRIRPLRPQSRKVKTSADPVDFWRSLHAVLQPHSSGHAVPWIGFTLHAQPQQPASLGAIIAGGGREPVAQKADARRSVPRPARLRRHFVTSGRRTLAPVVVAANQVSEVDSDPGVLLRASIKRAMTKIVLGQDAETIVDEVTDPLAQVLTPGMVVCWRELRLSKPPHFLIRIPEEFTSDALGTLAASLRTPAGVVHTEVQVIVRPRRDFDLQTPWRVFARRRYVGMRSKDILGATTETKSLESKMHSESYDVSVRLLTVAHDRQHVPAARAALRELQSAFGQYQTRSALGVQRFVAAGLGGTGTVVIPTAPPRTTRPVVLFAIAILAVVALFVGAVEYPLAVRIGLSAIPFALWVVILGWSRLAASPQTRVLNRAPRVVPTDPVLLPVRLWSPSAILSCAEVAGLWHLPSVELKTLINWLPNRYLPAQPHTFIPNGATDRLVLGYATLSDGTEAPVGPSLRALRQVMHLTAGMGAGKTRALANVAQQLIPNGFFQADGKGDDVGGSLAATTLTYIPREDERRLVIVDMLDAEWPVGMNPLHGIDTSSAGGMTQTIGMILALFARLDPETWGKSQGMQQYAQMGSALVAEAVKNPTLATLKQAIQDEAYRATILPRCTNIEVKNFWEVTFPEVGDQQKTSRDALLRRLDNLMVDETTRYLLTQPEPTIDFLRCMEEGRIVIMPLPHRTLGGIAEFIGMLLLQSVMRAAYRRPGSDQTRTTVPLMIDELQVFIGKGESKDIQDAITQLRGFGIGGIYAHQTLTQLGDLRDEMLTNSASRMILRTQEPDASAYARQFPTTDLTPADISGQNFNEHQYVIFAGSDGPPELCSIRPLMWPTPLDPDTDLPAYTGPDWQMLTPVNNEPLCALERLDGAATLEELLTQMVYGKIDIQYVSAQLALVPDDVWEYLRARWAVVRDCQREYIIDNPNCIPFDPFIIHDDPAEAARLQRQERRRERQQWLSRLETRVPRVLAAASYQRQRWILSPAENAAPVQERKPARSEKARPTRDAYSPGSTAYANGIKNDAAVGVVPPQIGSSVTTDEVMKSLSGERLVVGDYVVVGGQRPLSVRKEKSVPRSDKATGNKPVNEYEEDVNDLEAFTPIDGTRDDNEEE